MRKNIELLFTSGVVVGAFTSGILYFIFFIIMEPDSASNFSNFVKESKTVTSSVLICYGLIVAFAIKRYIKQMRILYGTFNLLKAACEHYNVDVEEYSRKMTVEAKAEALTTPPE